MNPIPEWMWDVWESGQFVGDNRPITRATISRHIVKKAGDFRTILFNQPAVSSVEIPNILSVTIDRRTTSESASMTMRVRNTVPISATDNLDQRHNEGGPVTGYGRTRRELHDLGRPGSLTFRRGVARDSDGINPWDHNTTQWVNLLIPNRLIFTFQGYGTDSASLPHLDTRLVCTGVWLIDKVEFRSDANINIQCRDLAKLLIEQRLYPPIVPLDKYPLEFCADGEVLQPLAGPDISQAIPGSAGLHSSTQFWVGVGGSVYGHTYNDAFDNDPATFWLSEGYSAATGDHVFPWIQIRVGPSSQTQVPIKQVQFHQLFTSIENGGMVCYVSVYGRVYVEGADPPAPGEMGWLGANTIPYVSPGYVDLEADIPYVVKINTSYQEGIQFVELPERYEATAVRLTFTKLPQTSFSTPDAPYPYKAAIAEVSVNDVFPQPVEVVGNMDDYTEIVKLLCAWSGFFWPGSVTYVVGNQTFDNKADADAYYQQLQEQFPGSMIPRSTIPGTDTDPLLTQWSSDGVTGRVWGDFFYSGAYPVDPFCIPPSFWDSKSVMDGINQLKEMLGFIFMIDSTGGVQWRPPNIWRTGNFVKGAGFLGESSVRTVSEENVLIDYGVTVDDTNLRSHIVVVSQDDPALHASFQPGFAIGESEPGTEISDLALLGGQQRVMLVANYPFGKAEDDYARAQLNKFAFLVSLWIHWSYRKSRFRIPGSPGFEIDDQVRIYERTTSDVYVHYIQGYSSTMDMEQGTWFMDVETHWLGNGPDAQWLIKAKDMDPALFAYLKEIGQIPEDLPESEYPDGWFIYQPPDFDPDPIIVPDDFDDLFPLPPELSWPDPSWSSETWPQFGVPDPGSGGGSGGSAYNCSATAKYSYWGQPCQENHEYVSFNGRSVPVDRRSALAWRVLAQIMEQEGWFPGLVGSYSCRGIKVTGDGYSDTYSNHAWSLAVDFDWDILPQGKVAPAGHVSYRVASRATSLKTNSGKNIFRWGGTWSGSMVDPMHFEVCCTPDDIASGIVGWTPSGPEPE